MLDRSGKIRIYVITGLISLGFFVWGMSGAAVIDARFSLEMPQPTPRAARYTEFPHDIKPHKVECGNCHKFPSSNWKKVRPEAEAFPDVTEYPQHDSCVKCHMQQFFKGARPNICSICHTNPSPRDGTRHPFPNPREIFDKSVKGKAAQSDFVIGFPHDKHIEIVAGHSVPKAEFVKASFITAHRRREEESCAVCHQTMFPQGDSDDEYLVKPPPELGDAFWLKKGTFKTAPTSHASCFTCHSADTGILPAPSSCAACHAIKPPQPVPDMDPKLEVKMSNGDKPMLDAWRRRDSSGKFRHEFFAHTGLECATCHNVLSLKTADPITKKISIASCAMCHVTPTSADGGGVNLELDARKADPKFQCVKCHITFGGQGIPKSHSNVVEAAGK